jgi:hypothetical protein
VFGKDQSPLPVGSFGVCCYWVIFFEFEDGDARLLLPLPWPERSGRCSFSVLSTAWRSHGIDFKAWSYSLASASGLLPGFNAPSTWIRGTVSGEGRCRSGHGVAFVVICIISRVIIIKMLCILLSDGI